MAEEEATSKRVEPAQGSKPGLKIKRPAGRQPMSKARASTEKPAPKEPVVAAGSKKRSQITNMSPNVERFPARKEQMSI